MNINIFIFCHNEQVLLPYTINHYKSQLPSSKITILDNESTDNSVEIAKVLGCNIMLWSSNNIFNERINTSIKNNVWKSLKEGWVIVVDMDEWLYVTEERLQEEFEMGTTVLKIEGLDVIGESEKEDLSDINLYTINKFVRNSSESKKLCFLREKIENMNYDFGAHSSLPGIEGYVKYSKYVYINRHMNLLGLPYLINKIMNRYNRSDEMRKSGLGIHYTDNIEIIRKKYNDNLQESLNYDAIIQKIMS
jgi:hypothetical protein